MKFLSDLAEILKSARILWSLIQKGIRGREIREALHEAVNTKDTSRLESIVNSPE